MERFPGQTYEDIVRTDTRDLPTHLLEKRVPDLPVEPIETSRYFSADFAALEAKYVWPRVWQMACRSEEIPSRGDTLVYELGDLSFLITRQPDGSIKAFYNSCLHRGRKLATSDGRRSVFRCPFHGLTWNADGSFKDNPIAWDFPQWEDGQGPALPEAKVDQWGGFVFLNCDHSAPPLSEIIAPLAEDFTRYNYEDHYIEVHVEKVIAANWKTVAEAFMESHHAITTHPQITSYLADVNSQYDAPSDWITRHFSAGMVSSPSLRTPLSETRILQSMFATGTRVTESDRDKFPVVPEGSTARATMADISRAMLADETGYDYSGASDAELVDSILYNLFPHMSFWATYGPKLTYRWRPMPGNPDQSIMDIYRLKRVPKGEERPQPVRPFRVEIDQSMVEQATKAGLSPGLANIFDQDFSNLAQVQSGLKASAAGVINFACYSELRLRLLHAMIDRMIDEGQRSDFAPQNTCGSSIAS